MAACEKPERLRVSIIPRGDVDKELAQLQPLFDALQTALGIPVEVYIPPSYNAVVEAMLSGAVQLARLGPASYITAKRADPRLTAFSSYANRANAFQGAGAFYYSLLVVRADGPIKDIASLHGKRLALVDPESTSGSLIPKHVFARQIGTSLRSYFGQVGYSGSHAQSVKRLLAGQVDAAFVGSQNLAAALSNKAGDVGKVRVVWRSEPIPADPFVYRGQLCDGVADKIRDTFLNRGGDQNAAVLDKLKVLRFVPVSDRDYQVVREIF